MTAFKNCNSGDVLDPSKIYRITIVPATLTSLLWTDDTWSSTAQNVPDMLGNTPLFAAQGSPTVVTTPSYAMVIDTNARQTNVGNTIQQAVDSLNGMEFDLSIAQVEVLSAGSSTPAAVNPANQASTQAASGATTATAQAANSLTTELSSFGKMLLIGIALVAVIVVASKAPAL